MKYDPNVRNNDLDEFITPPELATAILKTCMPFDIFETGDIVRALDPGANSGVFGRALRQLHPYVCLTGLEIMEMPQPDGYDHWLSPQDYFLYQPQSTFDLVIGNPPFTIKEGTHKLPAAEMFVRKSLELVRPGGCVVFLLRLNFGCSRERYWRDRKQRTQPGLHQTHPFRQMWFVTPRPSFYHYDPREAKHFGTMNTNAHDYAVYLWQRGWMGTPSVGWLDWEYKLLGEGKDDLLSDSVRETLGYSHAEGEQPSESRFDDAEAVVQRVWQGA